MSVAQLPHLANSFRQARAQTGLPPSPLFPPTHTSPAVPAPPQSQLGLLRTQSAYHPSSSSSPLSTSPAARRASTAALRTTTTTPATVRPSDEAENGEPPPPPYSRQDPEPEATAQLTRELSRLSTTTTGPAGPAAGPVHAPSRSEEPDGETTEARAERERRELEEAIRRSRESAEEEEALRLSRESAEAEEMTRLALEREQAGRGASTSTSTSTSTASGPPPLPARSSLMDAAPTTANANANGGLGSLAAPIQPIRTGSNNPFASALEEPVVRRYAPPPGPPPGHTGLRAMSSSAASSPSSFTPPPGPPPGHPTTMNPFADPSAVGGRMETPDLSVLSRYDTVILVDDSGSMAGDRWRQVRVVSASSSPTHPCHLQRC